MSPPLREGRPFSSDDDAANRSFLFLLLTPVLAQQKQSPMEHIHGVGHVHMDVSCSPALSADFDFALALLHNFWYARALEAFKVSLVAPSRDFVAMKSQLETMAAANSGDAAGAKAAADRIVVLSNELDQHPFSKQIITMQAKEAEAIAAEVAGDQKARSQR